MELRHLRYFEAIARLNHVTKAALELHVAQPALSKQLRDLEEELGVTLFDRVGRRVQLTEAGAALLPHARAILGQVEAARAAMAERIGLQRGLATVGAPPTVGTHLLPSALAAFNTRYPGIELRLREAGIATLLEQLAAGLADLAVVALPVDDPDLTVAPLFSEELVLAVAPQHPLAHRSSVRLSDMANEAFVLSPPNYELRETTLVACRQAGFAPRVVLDGGEMDTLLRFVAAGLGVALVPQLAVADLTDLVPLHISDQKLRRSLAIVWRGDRVASPAARALREFLIETLRHGKQS
jgi:LysR family transcriptional activator of glutamate synthase operon